MRLDTHKEVANLRETHLAEIDTLKQQFSRQMEEIQSENIFAYEKEKARIMAKHNAELDRLQQNMQQLSCDMEEAQLKISASAKSITELRDLKVVAEIKKLGWCRL